MNVKRISGDASSFNNSANLTANAISLEEQPADVGNSALSLVHSKAWWMEEPRPLLNCHEQAAEAWPDLAEPKTAEEGAQLIKIAIRTEKLGIIQAGRVYHAIRSKLLHGEYGRMWKLEAALRPASSPRTV